MSAESTLSDQRPDLMSSSLSFIDEADRPFRAVDPVEIESRLRSPVLPSFSLEDPQACRWWADVEGRRDNGPSSWMTPAIKGNLVSTVDANLIAGAVVGAVVAGLGYVGKLIVQGWRSWRTTRSRRRARLLELYALLRASGTVFLAQRQQVVLLGKRLQRDHPDEIPDVPGYERLFTHFHGQFTPDEVDLHQVIRSYTEHALRPLNEQTLAWLRADIEHRTGGRKTGREARLAEMLNQLEAHLVLWLAKYEAWIPQRLDHALVYLDDEEQHGLGFPRGIEEVLAGVLAGYKVPISLRPSSTIQEAIDQEKRPDGTGKGRPAVQ